MPARLPSWSPELRVSCPALSEPCICHSSCYLTYVPSPCCPVCARKIWSLLCLFEAHKGYVKIKLQLIVKPKYTPHVLLPCLDFPELLAPFFLNLYHFFFLLPLEMTCRCPLGWDFALNRVCCGEMEVVLQQCFGFGQKGSETPSCPGCPKAYP